MQIRKFISVNTIAKMKERSKGVNRIEKGSSTVSIEYVCSIANALDVTSQDILCDILVTPETASISEQIKLLSEKLPPDKQLLLLNTLEFIMIQSNLL